MANINEITEQDKVSKRWQELKEAYEFNKAHDKAMKVLAKYATKDIAFVACVFAFITLAITVSILIFIK